MGAAAVLVVATVVGSALGAGQASSKEPVVADLKAADFPLSGVTVRKPAKRFRSHW